MEKRYQVFVSSTYEDLQAERQEVMHALLELDCIPSGMELFPAANDDQWTVIKRVIADCDYYVVIVGGRYGSIGPDGLSYTEMEYQYALGAGKPCLAFLHGDPGSLPSNRSERTDQGRMKLAAFRRHLEERLCKHWRTPADLGSVVSRSLIREMKTTPATGWVRADLVPSEDTSQTIVRLQDQVELLKRQLEEAASRPPEGSDELAQEHDAFELAFRASRFSFIDDDAWAGTIHTTWNDIFARVAPLMIDEAGDGVIKQVLSDLIRQVGVVVPEGHKEQRYYFPSTAAYGAIIVQLRALGLITKSIRKRSLKDTDTYWTLTPYGDRVMTRLLAIKRDRTA